MSAPILAVSYHYVRPVQSPHPGIHPVSPESFRRQIDLIQRHHPILSPHEFTAQFDQVDNRPPSALLTFDDGLRDHLHVASILENLGLRGAFFVCSRPALERKALPVHKVHWLRSNTPPSEFLEHFRSLLPSEWNRQIESPEHELESAASETYQFDEPAYQVLKYLINFVLPYSCVDEVTSQMLTSLGRSEESFCLDTYITPEEMKDLHDRGHLVGCHGHLHKPFSRFVDQDLDDDINTNIRFLTETLGSKPKWLAYPYGSKWSLPDDTQRFFSSAGLEYAFTYERGWIQQHDPRHLLKRIDCNELSSFLGLHSIN